MGEVILLKDISNVALCGYDITRLQYLYVALSYLNRFTVPLEWGVNSCLTT